MTTTTAALDALTDAAHEFAAKVQAAKAAILASAPLTDRIGQEITVAEALSLPIGASIRDREDDIWFRTATGWSFSSEASGPADDTSCRLGEFLPIRLESVPAEATPAEPEALKKGDRVRITGLSFYGANHIGGLGTVKNPEHGDGQLTVVPDGHPGDRIYALEDVERVTPAIKVGDTVRITDVGDYGAEDELVGKTGTVQAVPGAERYASDAFRVFVPDWEGGCSAYCTAVVPVSAEPTPEPAPTTVTLRPAEGDREVFAEPSYGGGGRVFIRISDGGYTSAKSVHLSPAEARSLAATLTAIADADTPADVPF